jgi:hypothetical protein
MNDRLSKFVFVAIISISSLEIKDCFDEHFLLHNHSLNFLILDIGLLLLSLRWLKDILLHIIPHIILILLLHIKQLLLLKQMIQGQNVTVLTIRWMIVYILALLPKLFLHVPIVLRLNQLLLVVVGL